MVEISLKKSKISEALPLRQTNLNLTSIEIVRIFTKVHGSFSFFMLIVNENWFHSFVAQASSQVFYDALISYFLSSETRILMRYSAYGQHWLSDGKSVQSDVFSRNWPFLRPRVTWIRHTKVARSHMVGKIISRT